MNSEIQQVEWLRQSKYESLKPTWTLEGGYKDKLPDPSAYPWQSYGAGLRGGLTALIRLYEQDSEYLCRGPVMGFKVLLHLPSDTPQIANHYFRVPLSKETFVTISPKVVRTAESLIGYQPDVRGCYYDSERPLRFFNEYSQRNCEFECLANFTLKTCGCVKFSMPSKWQKQ